jgi:hypothetical protein
VGTDGVGEVVRGRGGFVGGVFEGFECLAEAFARPADVRGRCGGDVCGIGKEGAFEALTEGEVENAVLEAQGEEGAFGDRAVGEMLPERGDEGGGGLALFLVHPGFGLGEIVEAHGHSPVM